MKKKTILLTLVAFFAMSMFVVNVNAGIVLGTDLEAKAPEVAPDDSTTLKVATTSGFDFSKVIFKQGGTNMPSFAGKGGSEGTGMRKIILGVPNDVASANAITATTSKGIADQVFSNWFTAYCLDESRDYPFFGVIGNEAIGSLDTTDLAVKQSIVQQVGRIAVINDSRFKDVFSNNKFAQVYFSASDCDNPDTSSGRTLVKETVANPIIAALKSGGNFTLKISAVLIDKGNNNFDLYVVDDSTFPQISNVNRKVLNINHTGDSVEVTTNFSKVSFQDYTTTSQVATVANYNQALWIVEHTYPTLSLSVALTKAGVNEDTLKNQIQALYTGINNTQVNEYTENAVYSTIQYAIWKVTGHTVDGKQLGDELDVESNANLAQLNILYKYLITNAASAPSNYSDPGTYTDSIKVDKPSKELFKDDKGMYYYGPYTASYNALTSEKMNIALVEKKDGISIVDQNDREITQIASGEKFYIKVNKKVTDTVIKYKITLNNVLTFTPQKNRGRIYYPLNASETFQNAMSGGMISTLSLEYPGQLEINPKTGVENIALLLMITLVAFTLGYLVLSYKSNPIQLNQ